MQCTKKETAAILDFSEDTLENRLKEDKNKTFSAYFEEKSAGGKKSLRRKQFQIAMSGNVAMLIWLGKQMLNQTDRKEIDFHDKKEFILEVRHVEANERLNLIKEIKDADCKRIDTEAIH